jgi:hypothetical protein
VQVNDTIFIRSTLPTNICAKFHVKTPYRWGARGGGNNNNNINNWYWIRLVQGQIESI